MDVNRRGGEHRVHEPGELFAAQLAASQVSCAFQRHVDLVVEVLAAVLAGIDGKSNHSFTRVRSVKFEDVRVILNEGVE